jgi:hypothetical protein
VNLPAGIKCGIVFVDGDDVEPWLPSLGDETCFVVIVGMGCEEVFVNVDGGELVAGIGQGSDSLSFLMGRDRRGAGLRRSRAWVVGDGQAVVSIAIAAPEAGAGTSRGVFLALAARRCRASAARSPAWNCAWTRFPIHPTRCSGSQQSGFLHR